MLFPTVPEALERIRLRDATICAFASTRLEDAAREHNELNQKAPRSKLHGVPFSLKDEWETLCLPTSGGSFRHRHRRSSEDAPILRALTEAGGILLGKTNMSDLGIAPETSNWVGGITRNPCDLTRTAGGSSGGAAAAVADGMSGFDWGTDIGGSIRYPAALCGIYGLRLSTESWPPSHLFPAPPPAMSWLCAQGPLTRSLSQMRTVLETVAPSLCTAPARPAFRARSVVIHGPTRASQWNDFASEVGPLLAHTIGPVESDSGLLSTRRMQWIYNAVWCSHFLDLLSCDPSLPLMSGLGAITMALATNGRFDKRIHPTTAALLLQMAVGRLFVFSNPSRALADAREVKNSFERLWAHGTVVAMPVTCFPAPYVGKTVRNMRVVECTIPGNLADATALAIPFGRFADSTPRALQLLGPPGSELHLIELAERLSPAAD